MLAVVRRRFFLVLLTTIAVAVLAYLLAGLRSVTYSATSVLIVPAGADASGPGSANEAQSLASTYSELIPRDGDVLLAVATAVQEPVPTVTERLDVAPLSGTSLLEVEYTSPSPSRAVLGSRTAAEAVAGGTATSDTVPRGSVRLVSLAAEDGIRVNGGVTAGTVPIGIVLGLALGVMLAVAAERANRRIDSPGQVATVLDVPVFELDSASPARREALVRLWRESGPADRATVVAVTGVGVPYEELVRCCERLAADLPIEEVRVAQDDGQDRFVDAARVLLVPTGVPGSGDPHEDVVVRADLTVLVVPLSTRRSSLQRTVTDLQTYGVARPGFALVTGQTPPARGQAPGRRRTDVQAAPAA